MAEKNLAPSLVLQTIKYGGRGILCNPDYLVYFDAQRDIAVLIEKGTKKVIDVGHYSSDMGSLSDVNEKDDKKEEAKNKEEKDKKTDKVKEEAKETDIDKLDANKIKHIIEGSKDSDHKWDKLVPGKNWNDIKKIIKEVVRTGENGKYKTESTKIKEINGKIVEIVYKDLPNGIRRISDGWVK